MGAHAQDTGTVIFDLTKQANFNQCTQISFQYDHESVPAWMWYSYYNCAELYSSSITEPYYDDYLLTPELELKQGYKYVVTTAPCCETNGKTTNLHIYFGQGGASDAENFTLVKSFMDIPYNSPYYASSIEDRTADFFVTETGNYRVAFRGEPNRMYMLRTQIIEYGPSTVPAQVSDFLVTPDPDGAEQATVSFTLPSTTETGQNLTGEELTYNIYRDGTLIKSGTANAGTQVSYVDNDVAAGEVSYSIEIVRGEDKTALLTVNTYVGPETPSPVSAVILSGKAGEYSISWTAPTTGIHNAVLDPSKLTYTVTRKVGDESQEIASSISATECTDDFVAQEIAELYYEVVAEYGEEVSQAAASNSMKVGSLSLPFEDSFANAVIDALKWEDEVSAGTGSYKWQPAARIGSSTSNLTADAYDGDGGLAFYNFYNINKGNANRLMTMPISRASSTSPVVDFYLWRFGKGDDYIKLQIQVDGGEWQDIEDAVFQNIAGETDPEPDDNGWYNYKVGFGSYLPEDCITYRIAFNAVSAYGYNMAIDAVRIFNVAGADLAVSSIVAPETVVAGNNLELTVNISNNGGDVAADDYMVVIDSDFPFDIPVETVDISSLGNHQFKVLVPVTAEEAYDTPIYTFSAKVIYEADEDASNNECAPVEVATAFSRYDAPKNVIAEVVEEEDIPSISITWDSAKDLEYEPVNIVETFNDLEKDQVEEFNGWISIDLDGEEGSYHYNVGSSEFIVTNGGSPSGGDGNYLGVTTKSGTQQDDWLISPMLSCKDGSSMNFEARVACKNVSSSYSIHLELMYCEDEEFDVENPSASFKSLKAWSSSTYGPLYQNATFCKIDYSGIPSSAKYVALHFDTKTNYDMAMWVDDLKVYEVDETPLVGYHVYERDFGRLNEEALTPETLEHTVVDKARTKDTVSRSFYVTAIYPDGESEPSELATVDVSTSVEEILASGKTISLVAGGVMIGGYLGETADVYTLDGVKAASVRCADLTVINLPAGLYIVTVGTDSRKVVMK